MPFRLIHIRESEKSRFRGGKIGVKTPKLHFRIRFFQGFFRDFWGEKSHFLHMNPLFCDYYNRDNILLLKEYDFTKTAESITKLLIRNNAKIRIRTCDWVHAKSFEKCTCENCGKHFVMGNPYTDFGEGGNPSFVNLERFERKEIDTIWDSVCLCGDCYTRWKNKRTKIRKKDPASLKEAIRARNDEIHQCSLCKQRGHNRLTRPSLKTSLTP